MHLYCVRPCPVLPLLCLASPALPSETADAVALKDYPQVKFSTASATPETYRSFIASVRAALMSTSKGKKSNGIPVLLSEDDPLQWRTQEFRAGYAHQVAHSG